MAGRASNDHDYHRGEMDIAEQESTAHFVVVAAKWSSLVIAATILFFTMWLYPRGNFMGAAIATLALLAVGVFALRGKKPSGH